MKNTDTFWLRLLLTLLAFLISATAQASHQLKWLSVSLPPEDFVKIFPQGTVPGSLDSSTLQRLESFGKQRKGNEVVSFTKTLESGKEEKCEDYKMFNNNNLAFSVGYTGSVLLSLGEKDAPSTLKIEMRIRGAGTYNGPKEPSGSEPMVTREKDISFTTSLPMGSPKVISVLPPCPTDGNKNILVTLVSLGNTVPDSSKGKANPPPQSKTLRAEVFMFPPGTTQTPDVANLEKLRSQGKERVSFMQANLIPEIGNNRAESQTKLIYATAPGHDERQGLGLMILTDTAKSEITLSYSTLHAPYTLSDYNKAMSYKPKKSDASDDFHNKFSPHIHRANARIPLGSVGPKTVVPLTVTSYVESDGTSKLPVYFALVSCKSE